MIQKILRWFFRPVLDEVAKLRISVAALKFEIEELKRLLHVEQQRRAMSVMHPLQPLKPLAKG